MHARWLRESDLSRYFNAMPRPPPVRWWSVLHSRWLPRHHALATRHWGEINLSNSHYRKWFFCFAVRIDIAFYLTNNTSTQDPPIIWNKNPKFTQRCEGFRGTAGVQNQYQHHLRQQTTRGGMGRVLTSLGLLNLTFLSRADIVSRSSFSISHEVTSRFCNSLS